MLTDPKYFAAERTGEFDVIGTPVQRSDASPAAPSSSRTSSRPGCCI
jgi:hypothetical protein